MKKSNTTAWIIGGLAVFGIGGVIWYTSTNNIEDKKKAIIDWGTDKQPQRVEKLKATLEVMSNKEISDMHLYIFEYFEKSKELMIGSDFEIRIAAITQKYGVFS